MGSTRWLVAGAVLASALVVGTAAPPAGAALVVDAVGTRLVVTVTGDDQVVPGCASGQVAINGSVPAETVTCAALTELEVVGDGGSQTVDGSPLDADAFAQEPSLRVAMGGGDDTVTGTEASDVVDLGPGGDWFTTGLAGTPDSDVQLGFGGLDTFEATGTAGSDEIVVTTAAEGLTLSVAAGVTWSVLGVDYLEVDAGGGADLIDASTDDGPSSVIAEVLDGGDGDDEVVGGPRRSTIDGGLGRNLLSDAFADDDDTFFSRSNTDTVQTGPGDKKVVDLTSLRTGGRTITNPGGPIDYEHRSNSGDAVVRFRVDMGGDLVELTSSLDRPGRALLPDLTEQVVVSLAASGPNGRGLVDVVVDDELGRGMVLRGDRFADDLLDVTVPTGEWAVLESEIRFQDPGYRPIFFVSFGSVSVHGPWTDTGEGFVHRVVRDLLLRFAPTSAVEARGAQINAGTLTRAAYVASTMDSDEYRGVDVDRSFVDLLRRRPDAAGRAFWIDSLDGGNALWRFRAQLFGSPEYFAQSGGTNTRFVQRAYADVLGRAPDAAGLAYWVQRLDTGTLRGTVALQFLNSTEARGAIVEDQFLRFLGRRPTPSERSLWTPRLTGPTGEQDLIASLASGTEYFQRT